MKKEALCASFLELMLRRDLLSWFAGLNIGTRDPIAEIIEETAPTHIRQLEELLQSVALHDPTSAHGLSERLNLISGRFLGTPFFLGPCGEGLGTFDPDPFFTISTFDCLSYCETVLAIAKSSSVREVFRAIVDLRYKDGVISFTHRNHFPSVDWIPSAVRLKFVEEVQSRHDVEIGITIDKRYWFANLIDNPFYGHLLARESPGLLSGGEFGVEESQYRYCPVKIPFAPRTTAGFLMLAVVRPNSPLSGKSGGGEVISHVGFAFKQQRTWIFRAASERFGRVVDVPLQSFLQHRSKAPVLGVITLAPLPSRSNTDSLAQLEA